MIPISLSIEGLYSYQNRQHIDFNALTEAGLFGIFGVVGSGKSSILEAISFALYGEIERLNSKENRSYNMMNLRSNRSFIEFEFYNFENNRYRITRSFRRNSKKFEDVKLVEATLYLYENQEWVPQTPFDIDNIIGLSYNNFKRTIIIPQGQFKAFLELGATERTKMMKDLFNLEKFDLQKKAATLYNATHSELDVLNGQLISLDAINEAIVTEKVEKLATEKVQFSSLETALKVEDLAFQKLKILKSDFENLTLKKSNLKSLEAQKPAMDALKSKVHQYETTYAAFHTLLQENKLKQTKLLQQTNELNNIKQLENELKSQAKSLQDKENLLRDNYIQIPEKRKEESDLQLLQQINQLQSNINIVSERLQAGVSFVETSKQHQENLQQKIIAFQDKIQQLKAEKPDANLLFEIENWYAHQNNFESQLVQNDHRKVQLFKEIDQEKSSITSIDNKLLSTFDTKIIGLENALDQLRIEESQLLVQAQLSHFANAIQDGEACPLCGALEHPQILKIENVDMATNNIKLSIDKAKNDIQLLREQKSKAEKVLLNIANYNQQIELLNVERNQITTQIEAHLSKFNFTSFDPRNKTIFDAKKQRLAQIEQQISNIENEIAVCNEQLSETQKKYDLAIQLQQTLELEKAQKQAQIHQNKINLKILNDADFVHRSEVEIANQYQLLKKENDQLEQDYLKIKDQLNALSPKIATQETLATTTQQNILELQKDVSNLQSSIDQLLLQHKFEQIDAVHQILAQQLNIESLKKDIETYTIQFEALLITVTELEQKLSGSHFDTQEFIEKEQKLALFQNKIKAFANSIAQLKAEVSRLQSDWEKKKTLLLQYEKTQNRAENLNKLKRLFDRAGFVEYVSTIYLRQLCDNANTRFHRLTRNQLSLNVNNNNDFEIIDYLNEGKTRSIKTLSGGQSFQVSLSLALALAESVQANAKANKNFFFIDEGFGTLDADAVNIVFETLMNLHKENRMVGIISHVEALKDKMPISITVIKDETLGSQIVEM